MVAKFLDLNNLFVKQWKKIMGYRLVPESNHAQESPTCHFFRLFFLSYLQSHDPEILLPQQRDETTSLYKNKLIQKDYKIEECRYGNGNGIDCVAGARNSLARARPFSRPFIS